MGTGANGLGLLFPSRGSVFAKGDISRTFGQRLPRDRAVRRIRSSGEAA